MKTLALAFVSFLAGYGAASLGMEIVSQRTALELRDALDEVSEPYGGRNVVPVTSAADLSNVTVSVLPAWATLYARDE